MSVSFSGELSWELHVPNEALQGCYALLVEAGREFGLRHFGLYATESMRLEKGFRHWKADLVTEFNPFESALDRFVRMDKDFLGKAALEAMLTRPPRRRFVTLALESRLAPAHPGDSMLVDGTVVGTVSSAAWGHRVGMNLAMGFIDPAFAAIGTRVAVEVIGEQMDAVVCADVQYDPDFQRVRN
jgi:dimethylglycine dehydrogenase